MASYKNVELIQKANVYFDGNVTSRAFIDDQGKSKSLGIMMPGTYHFGTGASELMEIIDGDCEVKLKNSDTWVRYTANTSFEVEENSSFDIRVHTITDYCCSYIV